MRVRLAFSVAAHLEPEILLVDEVLAVGDAEFQKKCLGKMGEVAREGRTVLFVSHNMGAIAQLCERAIWLEGGRVEQVDDVERIVRDYFNVRSVAKGTWMTPNLFAEDETEQEVLITGIRMISGGVIKPVIDFPCSFQVEIDYKVKVPVRDCMVWLRLVNDMGIVVMTTIDTDSADVNEPRLPGSYQSICEFPGSLLSPGRYVLTTGVGVLNVKVFDRHEDVLQFEVTEIGGISSFRSAKRAGVVMPKLKWRVLAC